MRNLVHLIAGLLIFSAAACSKGTDATTTAPLQSCFDTGGGHVRCVATPSGADKTTHDVDGDGKPDTFVCVTGGQADDDKDTEEADQGGTKTASADGGKTEGSDDHAENEGGHDGGKAEGDDEKGGEQRCEKMGCRDLRKTSGEEDDDEKGDRSKADGGHESGDDGEEGSDHEHEDGRGDDMMCPTTTPPPTPPPATPPPTGQIP